jgi:hypothetical protein
MKTLSELLTKYEVKMNYSCVDSNLVYPMDMGTKFEFKGYAEDTDVMDFLTKVYSYLNPEDVSHRIANKYAIPFMQTGLLHRTDTYFYYQHDKRTWVICLTEKSDKYFEE